MLILECSQGWTDGSVTISLRNFVGEGIMKLPRNEVILAGNLIIAYNIQTTLPVNHWQGSSLYHKGPV
jgi:hypothetical protein